MTIRADLKAAMDPEYPVTKRQADYGGGTKNAHCAICAHFNKPDHCEIVEGEIDPQMWCKYFRAKRKRTT